MLRRMKTHKDFVKNATMGLQYVCSDTPPITIKHLN